MPSRLLSYRQAAELLGMPIGTLYAYVHDRRIPHIRFGARTVRFDSGELRAWIDKHRRPAEEANGQAGV